MYTSALCGGIACLVGAAANYSDVAEGLSDMVAVISDKAARAADTVLIFPTHDFRDLFARLYARVFLFYRDAILWYTKSKFGRAIESFNDNLVKPYEKAADRIESDLVEIYRQGQKASWARMLLFKENVEDEIRRQRQQIQDRDNLIFAGHQSQRLLMLNYEQFSFENRTKVPGDGTPLHTADSKAPVSDAPKCLDREGARALSARLAPLVVGTEGPSLFRSGRVWLPEVHIASKLSDWMNPDAQLPVLWISSPAASRGMPSSRAAAMIAAATAWKSEMSIISHFCERPSYSSVPQGQTVEQVGMIGLVYSLVIQLLQFNVEKDVFSFPEDKFQKLDGADDSWPDALLLLQELLRVTPQLQGCIIDGLNNMCFSAGANWCSAFLGALFEHQKAYAPGFKILLTTMGQSRVLPDHVQVHDRVLSQREAKEVMRGGKWLMTSDR